MRLYRLYPPLYNCLIWNEMIECKITLLDDRMNFANVIFEEIGRCDELIRIIDLLLKELLVLFVVLFNICIHLVEEWRIVRLRYKIHNGFITSKSIKKLIGRWQVNKAKRKYFISHFESDAVKERNCSSWTQYKCVYCWFWFKHCEHLTKQSTNVWSV